MEDGFDGGEFLGRESEVIEGFHVFLDLADLAGADEGGGHDRETEDPGDGHLPRPRARRK